MGKTISFILPEGGPDTILPPTEIMDFKSTYGDPGAVLYHDGKYHMFHNYQHGYPPRRTAMGYAVSADGLTWTRMSDSSVFGQEDLPYETGPVLAGSAHVEIDGTWVLFFHTVPTSSFPSVIGRATAPSPLGPWTADSKPALTPSPEGFDEYAVQRPDVVPTPQGYSLYYQGLDKKRNTAYGLAHSRDGINWIKYGRSKKAEPVFTPADTGWEDVRNIRYPRVITRDNNWYLFFRTASSPTGALSKIGMARSRDGINWDEIMAEPLFKTSDYPRWSVTWAMNPVIHDGKITLFLEMMKEGQSYIQAARPREKEELFIPCEPEKILPGRKISSTGKPMALIPAGTFIMGDERGRNYEIPHQVFLDGYYMDIYETTNAEYARFLNDVGEGEEKGIPWIDSEASHSHLHSIAGIWMPDEGWENHPVVQVSWYGAKAYASWRGARLPSEAEWEKAAKGNGNPIYPWGDEIDCKKTNYKACGLEETEPVGSHPTGISPYGIHDMGGNAAEWTADWFSEDFYGTGPAENPRGPESNSLNRVSSRGGSWYSTSSFLRTWHRNGEFSHSSHLINVGFRCVEDL